MNMDVSEANFLLISGDNSCQVFSGAIKMRKLLTKRITQDRTTKRPKSWFAVTLITRGAARRLRVIKCRLSKRPESVLASTSLVLRALVAKLSKQRQRYAFEKLSQMNVFPFNKNIIILLSTCEFIFSGKLIIELLS